MYKVSAADAATLNEREPRPMDIEKSTTMMVEVRGGHGRRKELGYYLTGRGAITWIYGISIRLEKKSIASTTTNCLLTTGVLLYRGKRLE